MIVRPDPNSPGVVALAVDDERGALSELMYLLERHRAVRRVLAAPDAVAALRVLHGDVATSARRPDVVFLDIRMPGLDGVEFAKVLRMMPDPPILVFVTGHDERALEAWDLGAVDYLMKPVSAVRLADTMRRVLRHLDREPVGGASPETAMVPHQQTARDVDRDEMVPVELAGCVKLVRRSAINWVEAHGDYARLHTDDGTHLIRVPLSVLEDRWAASGFVRIHRSFLVSLSRITELRTAASSSVVQIRCRDGSVELPVSRRNVRELRMRLLHAATRPTDPAVR